MQGFVLPAVPELLTLQKYAPLLPVLSQLPLKAC